MSRFPLKDTVYVTGLVLIILSAVLFIVPVKVDQSGWFFGIFILFYSISLLYAVVLTVNGFFRFGWRLAKNNISYTFLLLVLFLISAYALNRQLPVFQQATDWFSVYLVLACIACISLSFREFLPKAANYSIYFLAGLAFTLFVYLAMYVAPIYFISVIGLLFFGISIHTFIPALFVIYLSIVFVRAYRQDTHMLKPVLAGVFLPILVATYFTIQWTSLGKKITFAQNSIILEDDSQLPLWVELSQQLDNDWITERVIKSDLVYDVALSNSGDSWGIPNRSFDEIKKHDPLVVIASFFSDPPSLSREERIKILEVSYDARHVAQERLWSGKDLQTANVISNVRIFPEYRIAYTEKILSIRNTHPQQTWQNNEQEAIYTFHLPEGSVITSLSLWINGIEEKARLTTKSKADSAYKTIVGVESRDPSVIHWQEGNTVSVRVFPCTPNAERRFKIGITSPLRKESKTLVYENIYFQGPDFSGATETTKLQFEKIPRRLDVPVAFTANANETYHYEGSYRPSWEVSCEVTPVANTVFSFDGKSYQVEEYQKQYKPFKPSTVYLDLNQSWTNAEFTQVRKAVKGLPVFVFLKKWVQVTAVNQEAVFEELNHQPFSIFPVHLVPQPATALLISKSDQLSPTLHDMKESEFARSLSTYLKNGQTLRLYNLGSDLTPYLKTLKELRVFTYDQGDLAELSQNLEKQRFLHASEDSSAITIDYAQIRIREMQGTATSLAPDHLLRLFAYNQIMRSIHTNYFKQDFITENLISLAEKANVVSPVSSLIVLETQQDYDRFDIKSSQNSLKNASMKSSGAVPEPHEWLLIILIAVVVSSFLLKPYLFR